MQDKALETAHAQVCSYARSTNCLVLSAFKGVCRYARSTNCLVLSARTGVPGGSSEAGAHTCGASVHRAYQRAGGSTTPAMVLRRYYGMSATDLVYQALVGELQHQLRCQVTAAAICYMLCMYL